MMEEHSPQANGQRRRFFNLDTLLGFLLGLLVSLIIAFALSMLGFITTGGEGCPEISINDTCPAESDSPQICPTCGPSIGTPVIEVVTATLTSTPTQTATPTPNLAETATAACATFESQFPATPCP